MVTTSMNYYKFRIIKRFDVMEAVLRKAHELDYRIRDPRVSFETHWENHDCMVFTDTGAIIFMDDGERYDNTPGVEIDFDWFLVEKPTPMVTIEMPETEFQKLLNVNDSEYVNPKDWRKVS